MSCRKRGQFSVPFSMLSSLKTGGNSRQRNISESASTEGSGHAGIRRYLQLPWQLAFTITCLLTESTQLDLHVSNWTAGESMDAGTNDKFVM